MHIVIDGRNRRSSTGRYTDRLVEHLRKIDKENSYTILVEKGDNWKLGDNFKTLTCNYPQFSMNPFDQIGFSLLLYRLRPDVVHFTMTQQPIFYLGRIVTTTHDLTMLRFARAGRHNFLYHFIRMRLYKFLFWWSHKKSHHIIAISKFVAEDLAKSYPFAKYKTGVIYESSEPPLTGEASPVPGVSKPFIFHVGSPFPHKNIYNLIEAVNGIRDRHPDLGLVLAGKKEYYFNKLEKYVNKKGYQNWVKIPGFVSDSQLKWLYKNAACYALPSLSEGFGLPGLEAMAHGTPLVSSKATCLPEIYGDAALYFEPTSVEDMEHKLERLLNDKEIRSDLVSRGRRQLKKYSWDKMARETLAVYEKTVKRQ